MNYHYSMRKNWISDRLSRPDFTYHVAFCNLNQTRRPNAQIIANATRIGLRAVRECVLLAREGVVGAVPLFDLADGRGGSTTSEPVRSGMGAIAGGSAAWLMDCKRPPGGGTAMKLGVLFPMFMQLFTAKQNK